MSTIITAPKQENRFVNRESIICLSNSSHTETGKNKINSRFNQLDVFQENEL